MDGLHCLGGREAPASLEADLRSWLMLPPAARQAYREIILPNLAPEVDERITQAVTAFMTEHEVSSEALGPSVSACRLMMRSAARHDVTPERFTEDVEKLAAGEDELIDAMTSWYREALPLLRREIVVSTVAEHGNLGRGLDWRVDMVTRSHRGVGVNTPVAVLTFRYLQGRDEKRFTLQLLPELLDELRRACDEILSP